MRGSPAGLFRRRLLDGQIFDQIFSIKYSISANLAAGRPSVHGHMVLAACSRTTSLPALPPARISRTVRKRTTWGKDTSEPKSPPTIKALDFTEALNCQLVSCNTSTRIRGDVTQLLDGTAPFRLSRFCFFGAVAELRVFLSVWRQSPLPMLMNG